MKKIFLLSVSAIIICLICHIYLDKKNNENIGKHKRIIKIGAILPLTGNAAIAGKNTKKGIDLALYKINKSKFDSIVVIYEDTKGDSKIGVSAVLKLIETQNVPYIIDNSISAVTLAVSPIINKNNTILVATGASSPKITNAGKHIYRIWNSDVEEAVVMANFLQKTPINKLLIMYSNNEYGIGLKNAFITSINNNIKIRELAINDNNLIPFNNLKKYDAIYVIAHSRNTINIIKSIKEKGFKGTIFGTSVMLDPNVQKTIRDVNLTAYYPTPKIPDSTNINYTSFVKEYRKKYNSNPVPLSDVGYDAVMLFYTAIQRDSTNNYYYSIKNFFSSGNNFYGASGIINFDKNGDVHKPIDIIKIK